MRKGGQRERRNHHAWRSPSEQLVGTWGWAGAGGLSGSPPPHTPEGRFSKGVRNGKEVCERQCALFVRHKCGQHRPFTCFHWHFLNQRRRRPLRGRDGTFNYSPDVYCAKYDEAGGLCPDGDACPYLHRTTGDTERKYHLRYYKTGTGTHGTDARGHCARNGPHCAFAHGPLDLRPPVCDVRELQAQDALQSGPLGGGDGTPELQPGVLASQAMIEKILGEDPRWQGEPGGQACAGPVPVCGPDGAQPGPLRALSPCPGPPLAAGLPCLGPHCSIYKSTKCNDMRQTGRRPRGPFCAFAHVERSPGAAGDRGCRDLASTCSTVASGQPGRVSRR
ncbi:PREDICTED: putative E3 ubiquitin-protein ligase UNKL [Condylura cristata]|uniref:putative E3 ubiquitin-protein ligase UNKL n=1 Tax=Condylura cristata TaxID=143302 RepID=UPI000642F454|nr:PREDICTED: putative E3 ubiquitin-protein ligase UNKL [Condylura cristata]